MAMVIPGMGSACLPPCYFPLWLVTKALVPIALAKLTTTSHCLWPDSILTQDVTLLLSTLSLPPLSSSSLLSLSLPLCPSVLGRSVCIVHGTGNCEKGVANHPLIACPFGFCLTLSLNFIVSRWHTSWGSYRRILSIPLSPLLLSSCWSYTSRPPPSSAQFPAISNWTFFVHSCTMYVSLLSPWISKDISSCCFLAAPQSKTRHDTILIFLYLRAISGDSEG